MVDFFPPSPEAKNVMSLRTRVSRWFLIVWRFSRPHTVIGTSLSFFGVYGLAIALFFAYPHSVNPVQAHLGKLAGAWVACLCANVYIVGLNQLTDVDIDRINKPQLPLASGALSPRVAQGLISGLGLGAIGLSTVLGSYLFLTVAVSMIIGTAYSLPPVRLKRFPFWAAFCILAVRGTVVNVGFYLHFNQLIQGRETVPVRALLMPSVFWSSVEASLFRVPVEVWILTGFVLIFSIAIALFKDIPDAEGDRQYNVATLTVRLGSEAVFNLVRWVLTVCYAGLGVIAFLGVQRANGWVLGIPHLVLLGLFWTRSFQVNLQEKQAIAQFYQFIWKLFFMEYVLFPGIYGLTALQTTQMLSLF